MKQREGLYLVLAAIGLVATWYFNLKYFMGGGSVAPIPFMTSVTANALTTAITIDIYWSALVFAVWIMGERTKSDSPGAWAYIVLCFVVGLAFAFPLYLARRERLRARSNGH